MKRRTEQNKVNAKRTEIKQKNKSESAKTKKEHLLCSLALGACRCQMSKGKRCLSSRASLLRSARANLQQESWEKVKVEN